MGEHRQMDGVREGNETHMVVALGGHSCVVVNIHSTPTWRVAISSGVANIY